MKKIVILFSAFIVIAGFCFAADPVEGYWVSVDEKTEKVTAGWQIYQQGGKLYGKILSIATERPEVVADKCKDSYKDFPVAGKVSQMRVAGTPWIYGLSMKKTGEWADGTIVNPEDGNMYKCRIIYRPADGKKYKTDTLEMRGEIGLGIGRSQFWRKTDQQTASNLWPK